MNSAHLYLAVGILLLVADFLVIANNRPRRFWLRAPLIVILSVLGTQLIIKATLTGAS